MFEIVVEYSAGDVWLSWSRIVSGFGGVGVFGVVVDGAAGDVWGGRAEGFFGVSCWMVAVLLLAVFRTCPAGLWSGAYGGR